MNRSNEYYLARLRKDGRQDLLNEIESGTITVYQATIKARYRKKRLKPSAAKLNHTWDRTPLSEKRRFVAQHLYELDQHLKYIVQRMRALKDQADTDGILLDNRQSDNKQPDIE